MLFLIDGYNVTKGDPATRDLTLEAQRDALIARLKARGADLLGKGRVIVVFDGDVDQGAAGAMSAARAGGHGAERISGATSLEVRFSRNESADDALAREAGRAVETVCLVSSDRGLAERVRVHARHGWRALGRETLYDAAGRASGDRARRRPAVAREEGLPRDAGAITRELKDMWLSGEDEGRGEG